MFRLIALIRKQGACKAHIRRLERAATGLPGGCG